MSSWSIQNSQYTKYVLMCYAYAGVTMFDMLLLLTVVIVCEGMDLEHHVLCDTIGYWFAAGKKNYESCPRKCFSLVHNCVEFVYPFCLSHAAHQLCSWCSLKLPSACGCEGFLTQFSHVHSRKPSCHAIGPILSLCVSWRVMSEEKGN